MGFHISSLSASAVTGRSLLPGVRVGKLGVRRALAIAEVVWTVACVLPAAVSGRVGDQLTMDQDLCGGRERGNAAAGSVSCGVGVGVVVSTSWAPFLQGCCS